MKPETLIDNLRNSDEYIETIFMFGGCFQFYKFLKTVFPEAKPYKVHYMMENEGYDHIITKIGDKYYDITGEVSLDTFYDYEEVGNNEFSEFEKWSFGKNNLLFKRCPHCGEEVHFDIDGEIVIIG